MSGWHIDDTLLGRYREGSLPTAASWSVEQHVTGCDQCRSAVRSAVDGHRLTAIWDEIADRVDAPAPRVGERLLQAVGVPGAMARLLVATPALTIPWLLGTAAVLATAAALAMIGAVDTDGTLFLTLAALAPVVGVVGAIGSHGDPAWELAVAAPMSTGRLVLARATAVGATSLLIAPVAALLLPGTGWEVVAWVLPGLAVTATMLALTTWVSTAAAAGLVGGGWVVTVVSVEASAASARLLFGGEAQIVALAVALVAGAVVAGRAERLGGAP